MNCIHLHEESSMLLQRSRYPETHCAPPRIQGKALTMSVSPSRTAEYLGAIDKLAPLVEEHRGLFDRNRRLPDGVFQALAEAGLFRLWLPATLGGPELSPTEFMQVVEAASA